MEIRVEPSARSYILKKSSQKAITISVGKREGAHCGCSVGEGVFPAIKIGVNPYDVDNYHKTDVDGITVYYLDAVPDTFKTVIVKVEGLFFYKQLLALGH